MRQLSYKFISLVKNRQWYHQRFDGAPLYMHTIAEAEVAREKRKPAGTEADIRVWFCQDGKADWYLDMADVRRGSRVLINLAQKDGSISTKLLNSWCKDELFFDKFFKEFKLEILKSLSDSDLIKIYKKFHKLSFSRFTSSAVIDHFALGTDEYIAKLLRQEVGRLDKESDFTKIFSIATAPTHQSFINKAEMDLLKIAMTDPTNIKKIDQYQKKYFWSKNNYTDSKVITVKDIKREILVWKKSGVNLRRKFNQLKNTLTINRNNKRALFKKYKFSKLLLTLLKISDDFTWWQDERKKATYLNIYLGSSILNEIARRKKVDRELTKYLLLNEVESFFKNNKPNVAELKLRQRKTAIIVSREGSYVVSGDEADQIKKMMFINKKEDKVKDIRGLSASVGRVIGPVKIIGSVKEINKVQKGDILVAVMTRPDYIAGIKKAAAIVTNEGGITCHAAIVARELGIPCIIATKIATEVLKDGDVVEVNANHGVVKVIR